MNRPPARPRARASDADGNGVRVQDLLSALDLAVQEHFIWLKAWHHALLCGPTEGVVSLSSEASDLGRFGTWFLRNQHLSLVNQPAVRSIARLHEDLRERARALAARAVEGGGLPAADYDAFMDAASAFVLQVRRLERAFTAAFSDVDPLTGVLNRHAMRRELEREHARALRTGRPCALAIADLDHFKAVNDRHGHATGDRVLANAAELFAGGLRAYDSVYRYGGEEFLFCLPEAPIEVARQILQRMLDSLSAHVIPLADGTQIAVTCSFGVAEITPDASIEETIARADQALYAAKKQGRARVCTWPPADRPLADES
ncbi:MAG: diguanylate cyclase [Defluviicoccus sp.]